jgi:predicted metalloprotease with PDZ domain
VKPIAKLAIALFTLSLFPGSQILGQSPNYLRLDCRINRISAANHSLEINCVIADLLAGKLAMQFVDDFAGVNHLSERIHGVRVTNERGDVLPLEIRGNGLYRLNADSRLINLAYEMRLARAFDPSQFALISSIGAETAVLMMADLLPRICFGDENCAAKNPVRLKIEPPAGWRIETTEQRQDELFNITDLSRAVFFLGKLRGRAVKSGGMNLRVAIGGEWGFRDEEVFSLAEAVIQEQAAIIGGAEHGDFLVTLAPFPQPLTGLRSSAVTIGRTVVLLLNPNNDSNQTFKHYRRHLAHETFHFYLPNAFRIRENFDWFWEGFTRYVALVTLAKLRLIDLREYLDAIQGEYEAYLFNPSRAQISLLAASPEKFASAASSDLVYRKGMLVAALYDLELRWQSRGKLSLLDVMKSLYQEHSLTGREIGNREVLQELGKPGNFSRLIRDHIESVKEIDLTEMVKPYGLVIGSSPLQGNRTRLTSSRKLTDRQRDLLKQIAPATEP